MNGINQKNLSKLFDISYKGDLDIKPLYEPLPAVPPWNKGISGYEREKHSGDFRRFGMANKGRKLTEEHKAKINPTGRKQPESQKEKVANKLSKQWIIIDPNGNKFEIKNLSKFAKENGLDQGNLGRVAKGILKQHKGFKCYYK